MENFFILLTHNSKLDIYDNHFLILVLFLSFEFRA